MLDNKWNPGPFENVVKNKRSIHICGPQLNIIVLKYLLKL